MNARESRSFYWSSRTYAGTYANGHGFYSTSFNPQNGYDKGYGFSVRCTKRGSLKDTTDCEAIALVVSMLRIEARRVEELVARVRNRVSSRRPVVAVQTPNVKASRAPVIEATLRKCKRFG